MADAVALALVSLGTAVCVAAAVGAAALRTDGFDRLHFVTPVTSLGGPLVAVGLSVHAGWGLTTGSYLLVAGLLFVAGPFLEAATGRMMGQNAGRLPGPRPQ
ncbi:MAG TPA: monovalent cation/H(+) antiporter subunit G [Acidimicrobiales bacterium]|nr:monovalent cation/H(+) antiporter subunit G [Acidimicrobiales bacterium]